MINNTKESWENTITLISSLLGDSYIVKELYIRDYGSAEIIYSNREWTPDDGKLLILSKKEDIAELPNNALYDIGNIRKKLQVLYQKNKSFIVGNNFYYPFGIAFENTKKLEIPTSLNNIIYYGNRKDLLGVIAMNFESFDFRKMSSEEVYNYVLFNGLDVSKEDTEYLQKIKTKKICK